MPPASVSPIMRRRRLGQQLRRLRETAGLTGDQVVERVKWASASKLSRLENGRSRPDPADVAALLDLYGADEDVRRDLSAIARAAGDMREWLRQTYPVMTEQQREWAQLEAGCAEICEYNPVLVPGLLQTAGYARIRIDSARLVNEGRTGDHPDLEVRARQARQSLLTRTQDAPRYTAVLEEAALSRRAGPPDVLLAQVAKLRELATQPNIALHVLPRDARLGDGYVPPTAFSLYRFADPLDPETLAIEAGWTDHVSTDTNIINPYKVVFEWLREAALSVSDTRSWLAEAGERLVETATPSSVGHGPATAPAQRRRHSGRLTER
ncbi:XRE family transcriptional regulator [Micromonospora fluostatini]|uniref:XRE family transcriptional regulator n=1 Tax=Micromonospora fluostatini TaxID=1629071 RepID=A0ABY2DF21_9ACTN|nr:XRE family transcriptional regulator [Micromonospora fluostatini]